MEISLGPAILTDIALDLDQQVTDLTKQVMALRCLTGQHFEDLWAVEAKIADLVQAARELEEAAYRGFAPLTSAPEPDVTVQEGKGAENPEETSDPDSPNASSSGYLKT